ncbi:alpha/beta hydrolase [Saccharopolyspora sp. NFXS83]|uniref:alpha/beta hydrolase n=1 Tax=Saccharopolyspora sp. NFXS83 TaxID=2993560 RepID=UPI00224B992E|nr:alpha/beta hydrolase [Saccharopolyspora sp. NFXS83]MCX2732239.1 alpha/beta hydrolase [Saccharopolyspora sp. NFXS83]
MFNLRRSRTALLLAPLLATLLPIPTATAEPPGEIHFGSCPIDVTDTPEVQCGHIRVPLDYAKEDGPTIDVAVSRIRASGTSEQQRGALLVNPGGPGGTGLDYAESKRAKMPAEVRQSYDIIGFDPRGVGRSAPVDCGPAGGLFDHPRPDPVPAGAGQERAYLDGLHRLADDCARAIGPALPHINTTNTAHDMDRIRQALGEPRLNYVGVSYGTYLGAAYAAEFPLRTGRMVLDSVVSPDAWHDFDVRQGFAMLEQRDALFDWIASRPDIGLGNDRTTVREHYLHARSALPTGEFGPDEFDRVVYRTLSRTERWEPFARALSRYVHTGDNTALRPTEPDDHNYEAALRTVKCADSPRPTVHDVLGAVRALRAADPQPVLTGLEADTCAFWPEPRETTRLGHPDMPPVLLTQAEHDPTTPLDGARRMQARLPDSRLITLDGSRSHGAFASQHSTCLDTAAARYLLTEALPPPHTPCNDLPRF